MSHFQSKRMSIVVTLVIAGPFLVWVAALAVVLVLNKMGCTIWARGPEECIILGRDIGDAVYPLWALGYYFIGVVLWVPIGLIIAGVLRFVAVRS